jgi:hypothetical protein
MQRCVIWQENLCKTYLIFKNVKYTENLYSAHFFFISMYFNTVCTLNAQTLPQYSSYLPVWVKRVYSQYLNKLHNRIRPPCIAICTNSIFFTKLKPESQERVGPCWLSKLRWMGSQRVEITVQWVLPWLVRWARSAGTRNFYPALAAQVSLVQ